MIPYPESAILAWHADYSDRSRSVKEVTTKHGIKHDTMLKGFRKLGFKLREPGFRINNVKGRYGGDVVKAAYRYVYLFAYKRRADRKNREFTITETDFFHIVTQDCAYCGKSNKEETRKVNGQLIPMMTVDRFDSSRGYTPDNCVAACKVCNYMKIDLNYDKWIAQMKTILGRVNHHG